MDADEFDGSLKSDLADLWSATHLVGKVIEEYDAELDATVPRFVRGEDWRAALDLVRKVLKKHVTKDTYPVIRELSKWHFFKSKLVPMIRVHCNEPDTVYRVAKNILFMTHLLDDPSTSGGKNLFKRTEARREAIIAIQDIIVSLTQESDVVAAIMSLCAPALAPGRRQGDTLTTEVNRVDLFLSLIKQLLECPALPAASATAAYLNSSRLGIRERFILTLHACAVTDLLVELSRLMGRREFSRLSITLMDIWYQLYKSESADRLHDSLAQAAAQAKKEEAERKHVEKAAAKALEEAKKAAAVLHFQSPYKSSNKTVLIPIEPSAARKAEIEAKAQALLRAQQQERKGGVRAMALQERHTRFGTMIEVEGASGRSISKSALVSSREVGVDTAARQVKRAGGTGRKKDTDVYVAPANIDVGDARATAEGVSMSLPAALTVGLRKVLHDAALEFLRLKTITLRVRKDEGQQKKEKKKVEEEREGAEEDEEGEGEEGEDDDEAGEEQEEEAGEGEGEEEEEQVTISAFATLARAVKDAISKDDVNLKPSDKLKYLYLTSVMMGLHRLHHVSLIKQAEKEGAKKEGAEGEGRMRYDATPVLDCLDKWSFTNLVSVCEEHAANKSWQALGVAGTHLAQLVLTTHAMLEHGDEESKDIGKQIYDDMFRDREVSETLPRVFRTWEPRRFHMDFVPLLIEATHYVLKMADRAAQEGMRTKGGRAAGALGGAKHRSDRLDEGNADDDDDDAEGQARRAKALAAKEEADRKQREAAGSKEKAFESTKYTSEYIHPQILMAVATVLSKYSSNGAKLNYYCVSLLRRVARLPNEYAGLEAVSGKHLTYAVVTYNYTYMRLVERILCDSTVKGNKACADVVAWAKEWLEEFALAMRANPAMLVEAVFWRAGKEANAEVAKHYGVADGSAAAELSLNGQMSEEQWLNNVAHRAVEAGPGGVGQPKQKKKTKAAVAADEAEEQAAMMARAKQSGDGEEEDAQVDFDAEADLDKRKGGKGKGDKKKGKKKFIDDSSSSSGSSSSDSDRDDSSSSGSDSSDSSSSSGEEAARARLPSSAVALQRAAGRGGSAVKQPAGRVGGGKAVVADSESEGGSGSGDEEDEGEGDDFGPVFDPDMGILETAAIRRPAASAIGMGAAGAAGAATKRARTAVGPRAVIMDSDDEDEVVPRGQGGAGAPGAGAATAVQQQQQVATHDLTAAIAAVRAAALPCAEQDSDNEEDAEDEEEGGEAQRGGSAQCLSWLAQQLNKLAHVKRVGLKGVGLLLIADTPVAVSWLRSEEVRELLTSGCGLSVAPQGAGAGRGGVAFTAEATALERVASSAAQLRAAAGVR